MIKTQIQMPDRLFYEAKRLAEEREWSLAELVRRGLEYMIATNPNRGKPGGWQPPTPVRLDLYEDPFLNPDWRMQANVASVAEGKIRYGKQR